MKDNVKPFLGCVIWAVVAFLAAVMIIGTCTGCKLTRDVQKSSSDSTQVKKDGTEYIRTDSSKTSKEKEADRVTFIYPVDTTVNNYYTYPSTVVYERVKEKEQTQTFDFETFKREILDSVSKKTETKQVESKTKIGPSTVEWILIVLGALVVLRLLKKWEIL